MNPPHTPYAQVPKRYVDLYAGKTWRDLLTRSNVDLAEGAAGVREVKNSLLHYFACMSGVDAQIGRVLDALKAAGLETNTIVVFTSDHGNCVGAHNEATKNVVWDESLLVPFLIRWPGHIPARRDDLLLTTPDIYPTLLDLMGFAGDIPAAVQGTSHASIILGGSGRRPSSAWYMFVPYGQPALGRRGVRTQTHTLVYARDRQGAEKCELYDDVADPCQMKDTAATRPDLVKQLTETELLPWLKKMQDPWLRQNQR